MAQECLRLSWRFTGIIDFKGKSYLFGLNYYLNWAETPIHHDAAPLPWPISPTVPTAPSRHCHSGTLRECSKWEPLSSYLRVEGETIAWESRLKRDRDMPFDWAPGARTAKDPQTGMYIMPVAVRAHVHVAGVDFGRKGPKTFKVSVAGAAPGRMIEVRSAHNRRHIDRDCRGAHNRAASTCRTVTVPSASVTAMQDVYLVLSAHGHQSASMPVWNVCGCQYRQSRPGSQFCPLVVLTQCDYRNRHRAMCADFSTYARSIRVLCSRRRPDLAYRL
jgi:hypothetical protein